MTGDRPPVAPWIAAAVALGLGALAAAMLVVGHHPWDGDVIHAFSGTHGLHRGDVLALVPAIAGTWLAVWCALQARRPGP